MKKMLLLGAAFAALTLGLPAHAELKFKPGEDSKFHWADYDDLKKVDLKGETLTIFGPWRGEDEALVRSVLDYCPEATGALRLGWSAFAWGRRDPRGVGVARDRSKYPWG